MPTRTATPFHRWLLWGALVLLGRPGAVHAIEEPGPDAAGMGRAGAVVAADDMVGAHVWNPALVSPPEAAVARLSVGLRLDARQVTVRRWGDSLASHAPLEPKLLPHAVLVAPLGVLHLWGGAWARLREDREAWFPGQDPDSWWVPSADDHLRYGALRYRFQDSEYGLSLAYRPRRWLAVGAALVGRTPRLSHERVLWAGTEALLESQPESTADDLRIRLSLRDRLVPEGRFGLFIRPLAPLRFGLTFALPGTARMRGHASLPQLPSGWITLEDAAKAHLRLRLPWILRAAVGVDVGRLSIDTQLSFSDALRPRAPIVRTLGLLIHRVETPTLLIPISKVGLGPVYQRQFSLATGLRLVVAKPWLSITLGYAYQQGVVDPAHASASLVDPDRHVLTAGVSLASGAVKLDIGYARVWARRRGGPGRARQWNPVDHDATGCISSDRETLHGDLAAATLTVSLDNRP